MIELLYDLFGEISPMYFYFSVALSMICAHRFIHFGVLPMSMDNNDYIRECHALKIRLLPQQEPIGEIREIHNWITHTTKRIDAPDDDSDAHSFSLTSNSIIERGGQICINIILYSLFLKNIVLSGSRY